MRYLMRKNNLENIKKNRVSSMIPLDLFKRGSYNIGRLSGRRITGCHPTLAVPPTVFVIDFLRKLRRLFLMIETKKYLLKTKLFNISEGVLSFAIILVCSINSIGDFIR